MLAELGSVAIESALELKWASDGRSNAGQMSITHLGFTLSGAVSIHMLVQSHIRHARCLRESVERGGEAGEGNEVAGHCW